MASKDLIVLLCTLSLAGCFTACEPRGDDDDSAGASDDDDSAPATTDCAALDAALQNLASWPVQTSCSYFFSASTSANDYRLALSFGVPETPPPTVGTSFVISLDGNAVANQVTGSLQMQAGSNLNTWDCNDALDPSMEPVVSQQWNPIAGTATLLVTAVDGEAWPGGPTLFTGDILLQDVDVEPDTQQGTPCDVPDATWTDRSFGWLPG